MFLDEDLVVIARLILYVMLALLLIIKYVHFWVYKSRHAKEYLRFKFLLPYDQRERYATASGSKRVFMTNSNRLLYLVYILAGLLLMLLIIPSLA